MADRFAQTFLGVIVKVYIIGDLHRDFSAIESFCYNSDIDPNEENWMICLGDFGGLYGLDYYDAAFKRQLSSFPFNYFVIRGNHERRASACAQFHPEQWEKVQCFGGTCLRELCFPKIYYADDAGGVYNINGRKALVLPGAYSVDKDYRLYNGWFWNPTEQMSTEEMEAIESQVCGQHFDFVFSHTCPLDWQPTDLFLKGLKQSGVDNTMEKWMNKLKNNITFGCWCFGHYHEDRAERPRVEMFFHEVEDMEEIERRWLGYDLAGELPWYFPKSPQFYYGI
jgi:3-oxoacid CoA-transferase subunit A